MEILAFASQLLPLVLSGLAILYCILLFRQRRHFGWLLMGTIFLEPYSSFLLRAIYGRPLLIHSTVSLEPGSHGMDTLVSYHFAFPIFYILAVVGLYLLVRDMRQGKVL